MADVSREDAPVGIRPLLVLSVAFTSLVGSLLGYDIGVISGAIKPIEEDLHLSAFQVGAP